MFVYPSLAYYEKAGHIIFVNNSVHVCLLPMVKNFVLLSDFLRMLRKNLYQTAQKLPKLTILTFFYYHNYQTFARTNNSF